MIYDWVLPLFGTKISTNTLSNLRMADQRHFGKQKINKCIEVYKDSWSGMFIWCRKVQFRAHLQMQDFSAEVMH